MTSWPNCGTVCSLAPTLPLQWQGVQYWPGRKLNTTPNAVSEKGISLWICLADGLPETRAARDGDSQTNQGSWLDRVFFDSAAMRVGISFRTVAPGVASYPITTAGGGGVQRARTQAVTETTYSVAVAEMKPTRHAVHGVYSIEDDMRLPGMADAIERDMRAGHCGLG